jgi:hypothetical protein
MDPEDLTAVSFSSDSFHYAGPIRSSRLLSVVRQTIHLGAVMNPSIKFLLKRVSTLVVVTLAVAAVVDWSGLSI